MGRIEQHIGLWLWSSYIYSPNPFFALRAAALVVAHKKQQDHAGGEDQRRQEGQRCLQPSRNELAWCHGREHHGEFGRGDRRMTRVETEAAHGERLAIIMLVLGNKSDTVTTKNEGYDDEVGLSEVLEVEKNLRNEGGRMWTVTIFTARDMESVGDAMCWILEERLREGEKKGRK